MEGCVVERTSDAMDKDMRVMWHSDSDSKLHNVATHLSLAPAGTSVLPHLAHTHDRGGRMCSSCLLLYFAYLKLNQPAKQTTTTTAMASCLLGTIREASRPSLENSPGSPLFSSAHGGSKN